MTRLILENANLIDGDAPARRATLVIEGERITKVSDGPVAPQPDDQIYALDGKTVMPGMILGHYHASYWKTGGSGRPLGLEVSPAQAAIRAASNAKLALEFGFTGVISAGAPHGIDAALKAAIAEGAAIGPRIMAGSRDISSTGHSADMGFPSWMEISAKGAVNRADGPEGFRRAVREEVKDGAEIVKIFATGGHGTLGSGEDWCISPEEFAMAVSIATERKVKARAHVANRDAILFGLGLGLHIVDHGDGLDDACIEEFVDTGAFLTPSLFYPKTMMQMMPGIPYTEAMKPDYDAMAAILPRANAAGVKLLIGDDYGAAGLDHGRYAEELALYVNEIGIPALDVIRWATKHGAEAMGSEAGVLEAGRLADLLVVDGDPLADITILQDRKRLLAVMKGGVAVAGALAEMKVSS